VRKILQTIPGRKQRFSEMRGGARVEIHQVIVGAPDAAQRGFGPDDTHG